MCQTFYRNCQVFSTELDCIYGFTGGVARQGRACVQNKTHPQTKKMGAPLQLFQWTYNIQLHSCQIIASLLSFLTDPSWHHNSVNRCVSKSGGWLDRVFEMTACLTAEPSWARCMFANNLKEELSLRDWHCCVKTIDRLTYQRELECISCGQISAEVKQNIHEFQMDSIQEFGRLSSLQRKANNNPSSHAWSCFDSACERNVEKGNLQMGQHVIYRARAQRGGAQANECTAQGSKMEKLLYPF